MLPKQVVATERWKEKILVADWPGYAPTEKMFRVYAAPDGGVASLAQ